MCAEPSSEQAQVFGTKTRPIAYPLFWTVAEPNGRACDPKCTYWFSELSWDKRGGLPGGYDWRWRWGEWNHGSKHLTDGEPTLEEDNRVWGECQDEACRKDKYPDDPRFKKKRSCNPFMVVDAPNTPGLVDYIAYQYVEAVSGLKHAPCKTCCALTKLTVNPGGQQGEVRYDIIGPKCERAGSHAICRRPSERETRLLFEGQQAIVVRERKHAILDARLRAYHLRTKFAFSGFGSKASGTPTLPWTLPKDMADPRDFWFGEDPVHLKKIKCDPPLGK